MRMGHITIRTKYFHEEIAFYQYIVGLKIVRDFREKGSDIVFLADHEDGTRIEVIENKEAVNSGNDCLSIGFHTQDIDKLRKDLQNKGLNVSQISSPAPVIRFFFVTDPAGVRVQFVQEKIIN